MGLTRSVKIKELRSTLRTDMQECREFQLEVQTHNEHYRRYNTSYADSDLQRHAIHQIRCCQCLDNLPCPTYWSTRKFLWLEQQVHLESACRNKSSASQSFQGEIEFYEIRRLTPRRMRTYTVSIPTILLSPKQPTVLVDVDWAHITTIILYD